MRTIILILASVVAWGQTQFVSGAVGDYAHYPSTPLMFNLGSGVTTACTLNGSTLKCGQCGFLQAGSGTKTLQNIHVMIGSATKSSGTDLRAGIQAASTTTGPPIQPDGSWAAAGAAYATVADADITANTWLRSGTVGGTLAMENGERWCAVWEPENYAGSDSFQIRGVATRALYTGAPISYNGSAWAYAGGTGAVSMLLEFTDGSFGTIGNSPPISAAGQNLFLNTGSSPDEVGLKVQPSVTMQVAGMCVENPYNTVGADFEWILYNGTTAMVTVSSDYNQIYSTSVSTICATFPTPQTINAGGTYYAAIKPTTANNINVRYSVAADASYWSTFGGGLGTNYSTRTDGGAWSDTDTRRPSIWLLVSGVTTTGGGGGGGGAYVVAQ